MECVAPNDLRLSFVTCVSRMDVLSQQLARSPCLQKGRLAWTAYFNCTSAAQAFNQALRGSTSTDWLIWVHQDVYLPEDWDQQFRRSLTQAMRQWPHLAVAGVYGIQSAGNQGRRAGHVLDRGQLLQEPTPLPCLVESLDELLVAVRVSSGLQMDPAMGFDFYATDLVLQAQEAGLCSAVVGAFCEHWSDTPASGVMPAQLVARVKTNAHAFESKWVHRLPVRTPCFAISRPGDVSAFVDSIAVPDKA